MFVDGGDWGDEAAGVAQQAVQRTAHNAVFIFGGPSSLLPQIALSTLIINLQAESCLFLLQMPRSR